MSSKFLPRPLFLAAKGPRWKIRKTSTARLRLELLEIEEAIR
jgi:hypothetical protein